MENDSKKTKYIKVSHKILKVLLAADGEEKFDSVKQFEVSANIPSIERLTSEEILKKYSISPPHSEKKYTVCFEIEVGYKIFFAESYDIPANPIIFIKSKFEEININFPNKTTLPGIYFFNCITGNIELTNCSINEFVTFNSCTEIKSFKFSGSKIKDLGIYNSRVGYFQCSSFSCDTIKIFNNSDFGNIVIQNDCRIRSIDTGGNIKIGDINFFKSEVSYFFLRDCKSGHLISQNSFFKQIVLSQSSTDDIMFLQETKVDEFRASNFKIGRLKMSGKSEIQKIWMQNGENTGEINFEEGSKSDYFLILGSFTDNLLFKDSAINSLHITSSSTGSILFTKSTIGNIIINEKSKTGHFNVENSQIWKVHALNQYASFFLSDAKISILSLNNCKIHRFDISEDSDVECYINGGQVNHFSFEKTCLGKNSVLSFSNVSVYALQLEEFAMLGNLFFRKIKISNKPFDWWYQDIKEIKHCQSEQIETNLEKIKERYLAERDELFEKFNKPTIRVSHSTLGKTEFTNCPLADFNFEFNNSKITECFISGGTVPSDNIIIIDDGGRPVDKNLREAHVQKASFYNQLKKVFDSQGDTYQAAQFQAKWAEQQKKVLEESFKEETRSLKLWKIIWHLGNEKAQDLGIFWFNQKSNKHGEDWLQAIKFLLTVSVPSYLLFLALSGRLYFGGEFDPGLIGHYFEFLNPVRKSNFIEGMHLPWYATMFDFFARIFIAYGIYQFVAAFRKHGRKK